MPIKRITISVPVRVANRIKKAAGDEPVSAWVTGLIEARLDDTELEQRWEEFCREVGPTRADARRADAMLKRLARRRRPRRAA